MHTQDPLVPELLWKSGHINFNPVLEYIFLFLVTVSDHLQQSMRLCGVEQDIFITWGHGHNVKFVLFRVLCQEVLVGLKYKELVDFSVPVESDEILAEQMSDLIT